MKTNNLFNLILIIFFINIYFVKNEYVIFDLKTYKNNSNYYDEYEKFFYDNLYNMLYSEIPIGPNKEKYIMEIKTNTYGFSIYNHNCEIPPIESTHSSNYSSDFGNSTVFRPIRPYIPKFGEYYACVLENIINIKTNNGESSTKINYLFSPRNVTEYAPKLLLRPYSCFRLGFELLYEENDIDKINDLSLNLIFQFKRSNIISSYNWFIEYDPKDKEKGKLILGAFPHEYDPKKYNEANSKKINSIIRMDKTFFWDIEVNEIYMKNKTGLILDNEINQYLKCSLEPSLGVIFGSMGYKNYIEENFFSALIKEKKCFRSNPLILNTYIIYYCNKDMKQYLKDNFPSNIFILQFFLIDMKENFGD